MKYNEIKDIQMDWRILPKPLYLEHCVIYMNNQRRTEMTTVAESYEIFETRHNSCRYNQERSGKILNRGNNSKFNMFNYEIYDNWFSVMVI